MAFLAKETTEHRKMLVLLVLGWKSKMTETCGRVVDTFGVKLQLTEGNVDVRKQFGMNSRYWKGRWWKDMDGIGNMSTMIGWGWSVGTEKVTDDETTIMTTYN